eukprot:TRINITY_DN1789_c0_g1_i2.p1 TRINITY_DN1789_c0_g1~~TRINITY_DN1789_c0_g1_i2.p1  ORF type:complete len:120 (-),score=2.46 TRINITY_DN1789_c0_g1_i2:146-505(-)
MFGNATPPSTPFSQGQSMGCLQQIRANNVTSGPLADELVRMHTPSGRKRPRTGESLMDLSRMDQRVGTPMMGSAKGSMSVPYQSVPGTPLYQQSCPSTPLARKASRTQDPFMEKVSQMR